MPVLLNTHLCTVDVSCAQHLYAFICTITMSKIAKEGPIAQLSDILISPAKIRGLISKIFLKSTSRKPNL